MELSAVTEVLGGEKVLLKKVRNRTDLIELGKFGLTKDALLHLAKYLGISVGQMAALLPITERTIQRYSRGQHFSQAVSEHILEIAECVAKGIAVFENRDKFLVWMNHPNKALGQETPVSLLNSRFGTDMVLNALGRIEYGVFS
ncbi:antitoxin Xre/MbcA/ParS toxin-binding domain-containing protein [Acidobacteriota bacterium]